jgi:hypothetical protein
VLGLCKGASKLDTIIEYIETIKLDHFMLCAPSDRSDNVAIKLEAYNFYNAEKELTVPSHITCQFLNVKIPKYQINCSHIFQKRWFRDRRIIDLAEIHDPRNIILIFKPIEVIFDEGRIIFVWDKVTNTFKMKVLDPKIMETTIFDLAIRQFPNDYKDQTEVPKIFHLTIRNLIGTSLNFPERLTPFKRCFAFHASRAVYEAIHIHKWDIKEDDFVIEDDAWSPGISEKPELKAQLDSWIPKPTTIFDDPNE